MYLPKDFIETAEGLIFAVVASGVEEGRIRCFLRYTLAGNQWRKVSSEEADTLLFTNHPRYLFHSRELDAALHAVPLNSIIKHHTPGKTLRRLLKDDPRDAAQTDLRQLCDLLRTDGVGLEALGVTGSLLLGLQNHASDIDLVCYDRDVFHQLRNRLKHLIARNKCQFLNGQDWLAAYRRRGCELSLDEYIWHEQRKYNKGMVNQRKFDLSLVAPSRESGQKFKKIGQVCIDAQVTGDYYAFDYPAEFSIRHADIGTVVSFTATYTGQAQIGERILASGQLEVDEQGGKRIVVGSNREAAGEFIKVAR